MYSDAMYEEAYVFLLTDYVTSTVGMLSDLRHTIAHDDDDVVYGNCDNFCLVCSILCSIL